MTRDPLHADRSKLVQEIAGYLNFSSGTPDPKFLRAVNTLFGQIAAEAGPAAGPTWRTLAGVLHAGLEELGSQIEAFGKRDQAEAVLRLVFDETLPAYLRFHRDLLFHQTDVSLFQPFFLGRVCEAVLAMGGPWDETERIVSGAIRRLNDFIGYRPVAVLRSSQKMQPYDHEWVRPIPLYVRDAGVACGCYRDLIALALEILRATDADLLGQACFQIDLLDELAVDPRAYDFDHPVNRRPNNHFGSWDLHLIDNRGHYRRFVLQQVTLDGLLSRIAKREDLAREESLFEAAAVLACTMLMGSGVSGDGPDAHDSSTTLTVLVARIAAYRDAFYERLLGRLGGAHAERLRAEARTLRQPFGGVRQHLNQSLARRRAQQLQHVSLARLFARMGYTGDAARQAAVVPVASARMRCEIDCRLSSAGLALDRGSIAQSAAFLPEIEDWLRRAIECGALVDPWSILGFGGQYGRSSAVEDSVHDSRIDELIELLEEIFALYARLRSKASAAGDQGLGERLSAGMQELAVWWDQFASTDVSEVAGFGGIEAWQSSSQVAEALGAWHRAGTASGNVGFWREHVEELRSPKAYALLVEALLDERDLVAAMALLVHWLSQAEEVPLAEGKHSFHEMIQRWTRTLAEPSPEAPSDPAVRSDPWPTVRRLLDYLEANAESYWQVPQLELGGQATLSPSLEEIEEPLEDEDDASDGLYSAAYEDVIYRDTTDDGFEGEMLEGLAPATDFELALEAERISQRLAFLVTVVRMWEKTAVWSTESGDADPGRDEALLAYAAQAGRWRDGLVELLRAVYRYPIPAPSGTHESLLEFDQRRSIKETLMERVLAASLEAADAARLIATVTEREPPERPGSDWELLAQRVLRALYAGQTEFARGVWPRLRQALAKQPLLYLPLARGGNPQRIAQSRNLLQVLRRLLAALPRRGLIRETGELLKTIQRMERNHPVGPAPVTEFDRLFEIAARGVLQCAIASLPPARRRGRQRGDAADQKLIDRLERPIEVLLKCWVSHSRNVRVSVLDLVADEAPWRDLRGFIERYGHDLFTQRLLTTYGKLRAILHEGADAYLRALEESEEEGPASLLDDLDGPLPRADAVRWLELCLEAVVENYSEYLDYNSTTTQSDRGEMLYVLLDFLRIEASYERVAWSLKPVLLAHEVLVQCGRDGAARRWREALAARTTEIADEHVRRFDQLALQYGVRLRTVADRIGQRFVQPLAVDRLCALVRPAVEELRDGREPVSFASLLRELGAFTAEPSGVGFEVPAWLEALEREVDQVAQDQPDDEDALPMAPPIPQAELSEEELHAQIDSWDHG